MALALSLPDGETRDLLVTVTYCVVVFSILLQGLTLKPVVRAMAKRANVEMDRTELSGPAPVIEVDPRIPVRPCRHET